MRRWWALVCTALIACSALIAAWRSPSAHAHAKPEARDAAPRFRGEASLTHPAQNRSFDFVFEYLLDATTFQGELHISPKGAPVGLKAWRYLPEVGQESLTAIYPKLFGRMGTLICAEWTSGAVSQKLTVYRLSGKGEIETVFDKACRFGFAIIDVSGDGMPEICGCDGDVGTSRKTAIIYAWDGSRYSRSDTLKVDAPHVYAVRSGLGKGG